ncbi:MAG: NUDIX hydrolase [Solirubrobacteraceae bacterium]
MPSSDGAAEVSGASDGAAEVSGASEGPIGDEQLIARERMPVEPLGGGEPVTPREAATVILLRGGAELLEVLLVQRSPQAHFMAGVWVFPGGAVEGDERGEADRHRRAALRELHEEAGVTLPAESVLVAFARWVTPAEVRIRYDTHFFLAQLPDGESVAVDGGECVAHRWIAPADALAASTAGELPLVLPTIKSLERLRRYRSARELLADAGCFDLSPIQPRIVLDGEQPRILLPGEAGY